jgi:hypothetical protein
VRFETAPGKQLQIDFGERLVAIGISKVKVFLFVATLGYSRRLHVRAYGDERQKSWFDGIESSFVKFGGIPEEILLDNARALVLQHDPVTRTVVFNEKFLAFAKHWGFRPRACAPYRARTKGKTENGVGYVKKNAIAGRECASWEALQAHLEAWVREVADERIHGTTGETPKSRFERDEAKALKPIGVLPFDTMRDLIRQVRSDCTVEVDSNAYSVPWRLIGERVSVVLSNATVRIYHGPHEVAVHAALDGRRQRAIDPAHYSGIAATNDIPACSRQTEPPALSDLLRPLSDYEALIGGAF